MAVQLGGRAALMCHAGLGLRLVLLHEAGPPNDHVRQVYRYFTRSMDLVKRR